MLRSALKLLEGETNAAMGEALRVHMINLTLNLSQQACCAAR